MRQLASPSRRSALAVIFAGIAPFTSTSSARAQAAPAPEVAVASLAPVAPLPSEAATAGVTKFSFIAYGDTRGRHDGVELQAEHALVIESMLATIKRSAAAGDPIRFVLQSGDAVLNGSIAAQWTVSYVPLINRLTREGGVPYFLSVGNHDVGNSTDLTDARRVAGLRNYFAANAALIPPNGSPRRLANYPTFAFGYGNTFFIAFDSSIPNDSAQFAWVRSQLERLDRKRYVNVALFFHHPAFSSGPHGGSRIESQAASIRARWMPLFRTHHVRLLLTGHEHLFEHWVERYADATGKHRIDQIVSGGGGAPLYGYVGEPDVTAYLRADTASKVTLEHLAKPAIDPGANPFHYVVVHVDGSRLWVEVIAADWGRGFAPYHFSAATLTDGAP
ncbi:MAG TPA: metallophosphoesterase [Gemmatimonadaceae bacterium]|nr:metallophosphoesterase [Gemmatimonadaceae bacterium]